MAETPEGTIKEAATAYVSGRADEMFAALHEKAFLVGSESEEYWTDLRAAQSYLREELGQLAKGTKRVAGPLVAAAMNPGPVRTVGDVAWWSVHDSLKMDGEDHEATWSVVLSREELDWKIVHSHFSVHR